jgi:hypothetical protein
MWRLIQTRGCRTLAALAIIAIAVVLYFRVVIFRGEALHGGDLVNHYIPNKQFLKESVARGALPLWNPYIFSGHPFLANIQTGIFYPPGWLCLVLPVSYGFSLLAAFHFLFAAASMFCFARLFFERRESALLAALVFVFSGVFVTRLYGGSLLLIFAASWVPFIFYLAERIYRDRTAKFTLLLAMAFAMQVLSGSPQIVLYTLIALVLYVVFQVLWREGKGALNSRRRPRASRVRLVQMLATGVILAGGLAAVEILPSLEFSRLSAERAKGASWEYVTKDSFESRYFATFIAPDFFGDPTLEGLYWGGRQGYAEINAYVGILPLLLALIPFFFLGRKNKDALEEGYAAEWRSRRLRLLLFSLVGVLVFLWLSFGKSSPLFRLLYLVLPGVRYFRVPGRWLLFYTFCVSLLAGLGLEIALSAARTSARRTRRRFVVAIVFLVGVLMALCIVAILDVPQTMTVFKIQQMRPQDSFSQPSPYLLDLIAASRKSLVLAICLIAAGGATLLLLCWKRLPPAIVVLILFFICAFDLGTFGNKFLKTVPDKDFERSFYPETELVQFLANRAHDTRMTYLDDVFYWYNDQNQSELFPNRGMLHHLYEARGYDPLYLETYLEYVNAIGLRPLKEAWGTFVSLEDVKNPNLLSLLNVKYILTYKTLKVEAWSLAKRFTFGLNVYENANVRGWSFLVRSRDAALLSREQIFGILSDSSFDSLHYVLSAGKCPYEKTARSPAQAESVSQIVRSPNRAIYRVSVLDSDVLVFSEPYYPGWSVYIDGKEGNVVRVNRALCGVFVPSGVHRVEKVFRPSSFKIGAAISFFSLFALVVVIVSCSNVRIRFET